MKCYYFRLLQGLHIFLKYVKKHPKTYLSTSFYSWATICNFCLLRTGYRISMNKASLAKFTLAIWWGRLGSCLPKSRVNLSIMLRGEDLKAKRRIRLRQRQTEPSMQCHRRSPRYYSRDLVGQGPQGADQTTNPSLFLTSSP